jgi:hypothetical protein
LGFRKRPPGEWVGEAEWFGLASGLPVGMMGSVWERRGSDPNSLGAFDLNHFGIVDNNLHHAEAQ